MNGKEEGLDRLWIWERGSCGSGQSGPCLGPMVGGWLALAPFQLTQMTFDRELATFRFALGDGRHGDDGKKKRRSATTKNLYVMGTSEA